MKISTKNNKTNKKAAIKAASVFAVSALVAASAIYLYSPVIKTSAAEEDSKTVKVGLDVAAGLSIRTDKDDLSISGLPNTFAVTSVNVDVSTNSQYGYTLVFEDADDSTTMVNSNGVTDSTLTSITDTDVTSTSMLNNTWGYSLNETTFNPIPVNGTPAQLKTRTTPVEAEYERTKVDFGAKLGPTLASGLYRDEVIFTAYVNGQDEPLTMQTFTCDMLDDGETTTLPDARDGKEYGVLKAPDGKCWMTDNLALAGQRVLTPDDSDVTAPWQLPAQPTDGDHANYWVGGPSYDPATYTIIEYKLSDNPKIGAYYNQYVVTAGQANTQGYAEETTTSICPKGWKIPSKTDFATMFDLAGIYHNSIAKPEIATAEPYNFVLGGYYYVYNSSPSNVDSGGFYYTSTPSRYSSSGYDNVISINYTISLEMDGNRSQGFPVRCITR